MNNENKPQDEEIRGEMNTEPADTAEDTKNAADASTDTNTAETAFEAAETEPTESDADTAKVNPNAKHQKKRKSLADSRKFRYGSTATALTVVVIAAVVLLNVVAGILNDRYPLKLDLTKDKLFTLSEESKDVAKNIKTDVELTVFASESIFENPTIGSDEENKIIRQFREATKQYNSLSNGKVTIVYKDLTQNPTEAKKYAQYNINGGDILFKCGSRSEKISITELYSSDQNPYSYSQQPANYQSKVEQQLASKITMVTSENTPVVTFLTGHQEDENAKKGLSDTFSNNNFSVEDLNISSSASFNEKSVIAVICAPANDYSDQEIAKLRSWLDNNGSLDRHLMVIGNFKADCPNLYLFLNSGYGIEVTNNLISETDNNRVFSSQFNQSDIFTPFGDIASTDYTKDLAGKFAVMPACLQLVTHKENNPGNDLSNVDVITFPKSAKITPIADMKDKSKEFKQSDASEYPMVGMAYAVRTKTDSNYKTHTTNVLVSGCPNMFYSDAKTVTSAYNEKTTISLVNGFTGNKDAVAISSKPLKKTTMEFSAGQAQIFWVVFVIIVPLALLITCLVVFLRRRRL